MTTSTKPNTPSGSRKNCRYAVELAGFWTEVSEIGTDTGIQD